MDGGGGFDWPWGLGGAESEEGEGWLVVGHGGSMIYHVSVFCVQHDGKTGHVCTYRGFVEVSITFVATRTTVNNTESALDHNGKYRDIRGLGKIGAYRSDSQDPQDSPIAGMHPCLVWKSISPGERPRYGDHSQPMNLHRPCNSNRHPAPSGHW
jgi:hypothetical protein